MTEETKYTGNLLWLYNLSSMNIEHQINFSYCAADLLTLLTYGNFKLSKFSKVYEYT